eukprot:1646490-Amphidinium_carterae.1
MEGEGDILEMLADLDDRDTIVADLNAKLDERSEHAKKLDERSEHAKKLESMEHRQVELIGKYDKGLEAAEDDLKEAEKEATYTIATEMITIAIPQK